ncbi:GntR family transcriptional regulator [Spirilliplanes yamanashiensis]|uniref:LacI family transcriptional regulator n=1 Tax=Spirilliplanes yamanashiensis TaxID=42233 RepID=A0A8J3Y816_9ACTN|nr:substrate-binding domain-containing protein [Spirilliplanes yamanashiensis]MDP9817294.1 DNA-binding LacI/PurR family transcriptional regulator [Spirilliplanes yamanashiensis]GIJ03054.1 LacI family transcriptional regulator [Spirilliplanes yamanashiensis]
MDPLGPPDSFPPGRKFRVLAEVLRRQVADGQWPVGGRLPTEPRLAAEHGVGVNTVRRAVGLLVAEGVVERRQGSGTYVVRRPRPASAGRRLVGVLVPSTSYYYPRVIEGIERTLTAAGTGVVLASSDYRCDREDAQLRSLLGSGVAGLVLVPNLHLVADAQRHVDALRDLPVPYVLAERRPPAPAPDDPTTYVTTHHAGGVHAAVRHLVGLGHTRIGYLGRVRTGTAQPITAGFAAAAAALGVTPVPEAVVCRESWTAGQIGEFARACRTHRVSAVFCHGDRDAATLLAHARRLGMRAPGDLAVITYDDEVAELGDPPLTAVAPPKEQVGATAAELLLRRIDGGAGVPVQRVELQPRLIVRASCGGADRRAAAAS